MEPKEIINTANQIYKKFNIPSNLIMHLYRTAAITEMIADNWIGERLDKDILVATMLIHDLGNIVKIELDTQEGVSYFTEEDKLNLNNFKETQKEIIERYGPNDNVVNVKIAQELGANQRILFLINHSFKDNEETRDSKDIYLKIREYADQRTDIDGILSIKERLQKAKNRYLLKKNKQFAIDPKFDLWVECAIDIENQIFQYCTIKPEDINDESIQKYIDKYKK